MQVPMHPFLLLVCFNVFSTTVHPYLLTATSLWSSFLTFSGPLFIIMEGMSSLLVAQKVGQSGKRWVTVGEGEGYQFALLIATAVAYVTSAWIIAVVGVFPFVTARFWSVSQGISSGGFFASVFYTLGRSVDSFCFPDLHWVCITTNKYHRIFWSGPLSLLQRLALWFRSDFLLRPLFIIVRSLFKQWYDSTQILSSSAPLLPNIVPHLQTLVNFVNNALPKPVLAALFYRLTILHFASHILPAIGADSWEHEEGVDEGWDGRPVLAMLPGHHFCSLIFEHQTSTLTRILFTYRQLILVMVYSHLLCQSDHLLRLSSIYWYLFSLVLDHSSQIWWRWMVRMHPLWILIHSLIPLVEYIFHFSNLGGWVACEWWRGGWLSEVEDRLRYTVENIMFSR